MEQQNKSLTLGSLFDGSGGFPLGGLLAGITPVWSSEIEPFPIRVTTKRMPFLKHYGDVSKMNGGEVEPVDIITFGSPCQDMSVAGKRSGLDGTRSCLFYEAIRIVKEMRCKTNGRYPRYIVWENVPGAFSSNKGEDFRSVLEAVCSVKDTDAVIPEPPKGKWQNAGSIVGDGYSVAWRVLDAQFWGVPQRRRRIYLVADFASGSASEILFESEGLSGYSAESFRAWQRTAYRAEEGIGATGFDGYNGAVTGEVSSTLGVNCGMSTGRNGVVLNDQGGNRMDVTEEVTATLRAEAHHPPCVMEAAGFCTEHSAKSRSIGYEEECSPTLRAGVVPAAMALENHPTDSRIKIEENNTVQTLTSRMGTGGMNVPLIMSEEQTPKTLKIRSGCEGGGKGALVQEDKSATLSCNNDQTVFVPFCKSTRPKFVGDAPTWKAAKVANTLNTFDSGETRCNELAVGVPCSWDGSQTSPTLTANNAGGNQRMPDKENFNCVLEAFGICSKDSNSMKSANPHSGIYKAETARTLDGNGGNPGCNQGGIAVVCVDQGGGKSACSVSEELAPTLACTHGGEPAVCIQGSMIGRKDENGPQGSGINEDVAFTLNATDCHAIYAMTTGNYTQVCKEKSPTLMARDYKDPTVVNEQAYGIGRHMMSQEENTRLNPTVAGDVQSILVENAPDAVAQPCGFYPQMKAVCVTLTDDKATTLVNGTKPEFQNGVIETGYTVRRLTPTECARLQGFPDWWCSDLETKTPSYADIAFWSSVFETHRQIVGEVEKPKTQAQIIKWLKDPYSDAAEYKMWGNGVALPCVYFVLAGILWNAHNTDNKAQ